MTIEERDVEKIAELARLEFSHDERVQMTEQLGKIVDYVRQLAEVDTERVEPTAHVFAVTNVDRADTVRPSLDRDRVMANAPDTDGAFFRVPRIID